MLEMTSQSLYNYYFSLSNRKQHVLQRFYKGLAVFFPPTESRVP